MKWILVWVVMSAAQSVATGSQAFDTLEGCKKAQGAVGSLVLDISMGQSANNWQPMPRSESVCVNSETGERQTARPPKAPGR